MARPGLMKHRKFARLERLVGGRAIARASLELLWDVAYENGDDLLGDAADLEFQADWRGEPGLLAAALVESGFVDEADGQFRVHDLLDHAPDYVRRRLSRERQRQATGNHLRSLSGQCPVNGQPVTIPPAPAPAPALDERTNEGGDKLLTRKDWEDRETEVRKLANDAVGRIWRVDQRDKIRPTDRSLLLKSCLLALSSPCKPYGLSWLHEALDSASCVKRTTPLAKPGAYIHKVLKAAAEKAGRNFNADLASLEGVVPTESIDPKRKAAQ